jgi:arginine/lysine/ornithine decarboxylase
MAPHIACLAKLRHWLVPTNPGCTGLVSGHRGGAQAHQKLIGADAGDLISEAVLAIEMGAAVRDLSESIHPHPTLSETLATAAEVHLGTATDLYRPKRT